MSKMHRPGRLLTVALSGLVALALAGCGEKPKSEPDPTGPKIEMGEPGGSKPADKKEPSTDAPTPASDVPPP